MTSDITEELGVTLARKEKRAAKVRGRTWWCPFCDFSQQLDDQNICRGKYEGLACGAVYSDGHAIRTVVTDVEVDPAAFEAFLENQALPAPAGAAIDLIPISDDELEQVGKPAEEVFEELEIGEPVTTSAPLGSGDVVVIDEPAETKAENQIDVPADLTCPACGFVAKSTGGYRTHYARKH